MILLSAALAAPPPCPLPTGEHVVTLGIASHGHSFGGLGVVDFSGEDWTLTALSPAGPAIFSVVHEAGLTTVQSAFPEWTPLLGQLPFDRDLRLLHTPTSETCEVRPPAAPPPTGTTGGAVSTSTDVAATRAADAPTPAPLRGRIVVHGTTRRWRGAPGPARVTAEGDKLVLTDPLRGYTLTVVEAREEAEVSP